MSNLHQSTLLTKTAPDPALQHASLGSVCERLHDVRLRCCRAVRLHRRWTRLAARTAACITTFIVGNIQVAETGSDVLQGVNHQAAQLLLLQHEHLLALRQLALRVPQLARQLLHARLGIRLTLLRLLSRSPVSCDELGRSVQQNDADRT
jgi:hypothetical protein